MPVLINVSAYRHWVDIDDPAVDGTPIVYSPSRVKCSIEPAAPGADDERRITHLVHMRFHPQVTLNTRLTFLDRHDSTHQLYVRGYQNRGMESRELALLCEEVQTP